MTGLTHTDTQIPSNCASKYSQENKQQQWSYIRSIDQHIQDDKHILNFLVYMFHRSDMEIADKTILCLAEFELDKKRWNNVGFPSKIAETNK